MNCPLDPGGHFSDPCVMVQGRSGEEAPEYPPARRKQLQPCMWYSPSFSWTSSIWCRNPDRECSSTGEDCRIRRQALLAGEGARALPVSPRANVQLLEQLTAQQVCWEALTTKQALCSQPKFLHLSRKGSAALSHWRMHFILLTRNQLVQTQSGLPLKGARLKLSPLETQLWLLWAEKLLFA